MIKQGTPEWHAARCGNATASCFVDILAKIKSGEAASRRNYRAQLVCERMTGVQADTYQSAEMRFGTEQEPYARIAYEAVSGNIVREVGFILHPTLAAGASPDGLVAEEGGLEIKVPNTATHIETLLKGMSSDHIPQVQGGMWITDRKWWDFVSYDPRMPERHQLYVERVKRDDEYIARLETEVSAFLGEVEALILKLQRMAA